MKKILSLLTIIAILSVMMITASAEAVVKDTTIVLADAPAGIKADVVEKENTVEVTIKLKGELNLTALSAVLSYNATKVSIATADSSHLSYTGARITGASAVPYVENLASATYLSGWDMSTNTVDPNNAVKHFGFGYTKNSGSIISLTSGQEVSLFKVYFNKLAGQDVIASDFNFVKVVTFQSKLNYGITGYTAVIEQSGTGESVSGTTYTYRRSDRFSVGFTNYVPAVTNYNVTFKDWDGSTLKTESVASGTGATAPADPTRDRYNFTSWNVAFNNITGNTIVTAQYTIKSVDDLQGTAGSVVKGPETESFTVKTKTGTADVLGLAVIAIPAIAPVNVTASDCFDGINADSAKFGIKLGNQYFPSATTWANLNANNGRFFIKFVDTSGTIHGTYYAKTFVNGVLSTGSVEVIID